MRRDTTNQNKKASLSRLRYFGANTILGRFLLIAMVLATCTITVALISHYRVKRASTNSADNFSERATIARHVRQLTNLLWQNETRFQQYMLAPSKEQKQHVIASLDRTLSKVNQLHTINWIRESLATRHEISQLSQNITRLKSLLTRTMVLRVHPEKLFTAMPLMVNIMNPLNRRFVSTASLAIDEADESPDDPQQRINDRLFRQVRFLWSQQISIFRILASSRVGMFTESADANIRSTTKEIGIFDKNIVAILNQLKKRNAAGKLGFQQTDAIKVLIDTHQQWHSTYKKVKTIMRDGQNWRKDIPLLQNTIHPLFSQIWNQLQGIDRNIEQRSATDITAITRVADFVSNSVLLLAVAVVLIVLLATLVFEIQIRRPIAKVSHALKAEADGKYAFTELPTTSLMETRNLVTAFANMREQVHNRQEHLQAVLTYAVESILTTDIDGMIESINPAACILFACGEQDAIGLPVTRLLPDIKQYMATPTSHEIELQARRSDGTEMPAGVTISTMQVGNKRQFLIILSDISERRAMLEEITAREQRLRSILDNTAEAIVTFDKSYKIETWNAAAEHLFGWSEQDVIGEHFDKYISINGAVSQSHSTHPGSLKHLVGIETEVVGHHKNGNDYPVSLKLSRMQIDNRVKYTALVANITERKAMMENLRRLAEHDSLTGLHNRAYFHAELERIVEHTNTDENLSCALLYIDLDNFKYINDTLGHAAGDKLLVEVSHLLNDRTRRSDVVARLGGDEFVLLISNARHDIVQAIADSFRRTLADYTFHYDGRSVDVGCSIGVALITDRQKTPGEVLSQADLACHLAKRAGRNRVHIFTEHDDGSVRTMSIDMGWSRRIKHAIEHDKYLLALQPIMDCATLAVEEFEVLIRMQDDDGSIIMPNGFLPTAERFGLSSEVDAWVIRHALNYLARVREQDPTIRFAINLSGQSITAQSIMQLIPEMVQETGLDPGALTFEVTETAAIADMHKAVQLLSQLQEQGCQTALDDFGSGMSSFAYLRELPVDIVKIDGRFVKNITQNSVDFALVHAMNEIAHALGKKTVAEFIEDQKSYKIIADIGIDRCQGYFLGKPVIVDTSLPRLDETLSLLAIRN